MHDRLSLKGMCSGSHEVFKFWEISDDKWVQNTDMNAMATFSKRQLQAKCAFRFIVIGLAD